MEPAHTIELLAGHVDKKDVRHTRVVFGHRVTAKDVFNADDHPQGQLATSYNALIQRAAIIEFGTLAMPVALNVLLGLDSIDREDLVDGFNTFQTLSADGRTAELLSESEHRWRLFSGFKSFPQAGEEATDRLIYSVVQMGRRITGLDEVEADRLGLKAGIKRECFLVGKQIASIATEDGTAQVEGPIGLEYFQTLDAADVSTLRGAAEVWRQSFRLSRRAVSENGNSQNSNAADAGAEAARVGDPVVAG